MKRYDYTTARQVLIVTSIIFIAQLTTEIVGQRKEGFEWIFPASCVLVGLSILYTACLVVLNAKQRKEVE